jgi:hypothetical protein
MRIRMERREQRLRQDSIDARRKVLVRHVLISFPIYTRVWFWCVFFFQF